MSASFVPEYQESRFQPTMQLLSVNCPITFELLGGFNILFCFLSYFYLTQNDIQKILSKHLLYTQIKNISMHIIINES